MGGGRKGHGGGQGNKGRKSPTKTTKTTKTQSPSKSPTKTTKTTKTPGGQGNQGKFKRAKGTVNVTKTVKNITKNITKTVSNIGNKFNKLKIKKTPVKTGPTPKVKKVNPIVKKNIAIHGEDKVKALQKQYSDFKIARKEGTLGIHRGKLADGTYYSKDPTDAQKRTDIKLSAIQQKQYNQFKKAESLKSKSFKQQLTDIANWSTEENFKNPLSIAKKTYDFSNPIKGIKSYLNLGKDVGTAGSNVWNTVSASGFLKRAGDAIEKRGAVGAISGFFKKDDKFAKALAGSERFSEARNAYLGENQKLDIASDLLNAPKAWQALTQKPNVQKYTDVGKSWYKRPIASHFIGNAAWYANPDNNPDAARRALLPSRFNRALNLGEGKSAQSLNTLRSLAGAYGSTKEAIQNPLKVLGNVFSRDAAGTKGGKLRIRSVDLNKRGVTANPYESSGQAATDSATLSDYWIEQNRINKAAEERLAGIASDKSEYTKLIDQLNVQRDAYTGEVDRIRPIGQSIGDELARIQPIGKGYQDELARIQPIGKEYSDELARVQPFGKEFTTGLADLRKDQKYLQSFKGQDLHPDDVKYLSTELPKYQTAISNLEKQYKDYQSGIASLKAGQKDYQSYLGDVQSNIKDYQSYLGEIQGGQKEYQSYLSGIQSQQKQLADFTQTQYGKYKELQDYEKEFISAKDKSDRDARSYTIRSQQKISTGLRPGVSGIRQRSGLRTFGSGKTRTTKKRFNRDFRIGSFGDTSMSPINV